MDTLIIANSNGKRQVWGNFKEVDKFIKDTLSENPGASVSVLLDKLEPETVTVNAAEVN